MGVLATGIIIAILYPSIMLVLKAIGYTGEEDQDEKGC